MAPPLHPTSTSSANRPWLATPAPIAHLFTRYPLHTLPPNPLPARTLPPPARQRHQLFIYTQSLEHGPDVPSYNPTCLQWQAYLRFRGIEFDVVPSDNHASPSGALPFLLPAVYEPGDAGAAQRAVQGPVPISAGSLKAWVQEQQREKRRPGPAEEHEAADRGAKQEADGVVRGAAAYLALIERRIRPAWVR